MSDFLQLVNKIVRWNCNALSVPIPTIRIAEPTELPTPTVKCSVLIDLDNINSGELLINRTFANSNADTLFMWLAFSHECRHIWQALNADMFADYQTSASLTLAKYNAQPAEIDAWAWAVVVWTNLFGIRPTLEKNFGAEVWAQIQARARQIAADF